jgi:hypothetical protein
VQNHWNRIVAIGLAVSGFYYWPPLPAIERLFRLEAQIGFGDGRIIGAIFIVGAAIIWFIRPPPP